MKLLRDYNLDELQDKIDEVGEFTMKNELTAEEETRDI